MEKFDFNKPLKVTCIFEDSDSDGNIVEKEIPESIPVQYPSPQHNSLEELLTAPPIDNYNNARKNTLNIEHEKLHIHGNCNKTMQNTHAGPYKSMGNLQPSARETNTYIENTEALNYNYKTANEKEHFINMLDTISETFITLTKYYHYYDSKYKKDHSVREEYVNRKNALFHQIYHQSLSILVPQEHNHAFISNFIRRTIEIAHRKQWHHHMDINSIRTLVNALIIWTKQKKKYLESRNKDVTPPTMPVQQVPTSFNISNINSREPMSGTTPISSASRSNSNLNPLNPPPYDSCHDILSPTVPQGSLSAMVDTMNRIAPNAMPAQSVPPVRIPNRTINAVSSIRQPPIPVSNRGYNVQQHNMNQGSSLASTINQMNGSAPVPSVPSLNSRFTQQQNSVQSLPQVTTSNSAFNAQHQMNGTHPVSAMSTLYAIPSPINNPHMNGAQSIPPILTSNSGFNVRHMNCDHSVSGVPTSNSIFHSQQQMNGVPPMATSYNGFHVNRQKVGVPCYVLPVQTSNSGYTVENGINGAYSVSAVPTSNSGLTVSAVATSNTGLNVHLGINSPPAVTSNNSPNGANNTPKKTPAKSKKSSYGRTTVLRSPALPPATKTKSASNSSNIVQQQMTGGSMSEPQRVSNLPPTASNDAHINEKTPTEDLNDSIPLFSTGPPGNEISISVDRTVVNKVILEKVRELSENQSIKRSKTANDNQNPKRLCKETWHPPCNDVQQIIESNRTQTQLNTEIEKNMNKANQFQTSLETSNNQDKVSCEIPFRARSVSRDSGFGSPVLPVMQSDNNTVINNHVTLKKVNFTYRNDSWFV